MFKPVLGAAVALAALTIAPALSASAVQDPAPAPQSYEAQRAAVPAAKAAAVRAQVAQSVTARPLLRVPFRCGETWSGASRAGHSPSYYAVDLNWGSGSDDLGKPVKTSAAGTVVRSSYDAGGYGNYIEIAHGDGWHTLYAHLQNRGVAVGDHVTDSQQIGHVGGTGNVTAPHLHYEQIKDGVVVAALFGTSTWVAYPGPAGYTRIRDC
ncbi:peptidase M23-like protein [Kribbella voronezhensis]|uniref:Peptidase M23-like protein n=1 Tax=Kribbella voronezhensis TaxID=2512212 RepID=A0A4R7TER3_9ACTN|nr:M23 family metallopeptidase [Kribbella voronezhensis]TDU90691.1 peptidase M23-like protein [Kribbella voronezhensis]